MTPALVDTRSLYDDLAAVYLWIAGAVFVLVVLGMAYMLVRFRAGRDPDRRPGRRNESMPVESGYVVLLVLACAVLLVLTFHTQGRIEGLTPAAAKDRGAVRVDVIGAQWQWRFRYPGAPVVEQDGHGGRPPELVVPVGRRVLFRGWSQDVLHDFWLPDLKFQRQVWPDHVEEWALVFPHAGSYVGVCAWFCGLDHKNMHFVATALPADRFDAWLARRRQETAR